MYIGVFPEGPTVFLTQFLQEPIWGMLLAELLQLI